MEKKLEFLLCQIGLVGVYFLQLSYLPIKGILVDICFQEESIAFFCWF